MFVRDFIHVGQPFEAVAPRFVADPSWLGPIAEDAARVAHDVALSLFPPAIGGSQRTRRARPVRCEIGPVRARDSSLLVPLWLMRTDPDAVLPDLAGDLEVAPVGAMRSLLAFGATYRREGSDAATRERIERATEAGVRTFLTGIAANLGAPVGAGGTEPR